MTRARPHHAGPTRGWPQTPRRTRAAGGPWRYARRGGKLLPHGHQHERTPRLIPLPPPQATLGTRGWWAYE
jgi:hypothetical protein